MGQDSRQLVEALTVDDVIASVLILSDLRQFSANPRVIHSAFHELAKSAKIKELDDLRFSEDEKFPFSRVLEQVMFRLEMSGLIVLRNPDYDMYEVDGKRRRDFLKKIAETYPPELVARLDSLSSAFVKRIITEP